MRYRKLSNKAFGLYGVVTEHLMLRGDACDERLITIFNMCLSAGHIPMDWRIVRSINV